MLCYTSVTVSHPLAMMSSKPTLVLFVAQGATCYGVMGMK